MKFFEKNMKDKFTGPMFRRLLIPAIISSLGWALSDMADAVVVGQKLGTVGLAAISLILPIYMINCAIVHGLGIGGSTNFTKLASEGKIKEAKENYTSIMFVGLVLSVLTAVLGNVFIDPLLKVLGTVKENGELFIKTKDYLRVLLSATPLFYFSNLFNYYLRNDNGEVIASVGSVTGNIVDIACNISFVLFFGLGTFGAALSTAIGQIVAIVIYCFGVFKKDNNLQLVKVTRENFNKALVCLKNGSATSIKYIYSVIFFLICNKALMYNPGEVGVAVFDLVQNTSYLIIYLYEGTSRAMQPIVSTYQGEHNVEGKRTIYVMGMYSGLLLGLVLILFILVYPNSMCLLFGISGTEAQATAEYVLRLYVVGAFFAGLNIINANYYQSCEQEKAPFLIETLRGAAVLLPLTFLFSLIENRTYFWLLFPLTEIITFVIFVILRKRFVVPELDENRIFQKTIQSNVEDITMFADQADEFCEKFDGTMKQQLVIRMTIEEISMAIVKHGLKGRDDGYLQITILALEDGLFEVHLRDNAITFNPFELVKDENIDLDSDFSAVGVDVIKKQSKYFFYRRYQGFNSMIIRL